MAAEKNHGLIIVYTGDGKGKTTAALGMALRAMGYGWKIAILQFVKGTWKTGEREFLKKTGGGITYEQLGIGFVTWKPTRPFEEHLDAAHQAWDRAKNIVMSDEYDLIILDEINNATRFKLLPVDDVLKLIEEKPERLHIVLTGRGADQRIIDRADLVTEMKMVKHPFEKGKMAARGIDY